MTRRLETAKGDVEILLKDGFRLLMTYDRTQPFINLKAEQLSKATYPKDKQALLDNLQSTLDGTPGMKEKKPSHGKLADFDVYGINRIRLEGGVLSIYLLFNDKNNIAVTVYLLNAEPAERKFHTPEQYEKIKDRFLSAYTGCLSTAVTN